ncbi:MAG: hypothetical protein ACLUVG_16065 [Phocaeicola vulgatus]
MVKSITTDNLRATCPARPYPVLPEGYRRDEPRRRQRPCHLYRHRRTKRVATQEGTFERGMP